MAFKIENALAGAGSAGAANLLFGGGKQSTLVSVLAGFGFGGTRKKIGHAAGYSAAGGAALGAGSFALRDTSLGRDGVKSIPGAVKAGARSVGAGLAKFQREGGITGAIAGAVRRARSSTKDLKLPNLGAQLPQGYSGELARQGEADVIRDAVAENPAAAGGAGIPRSWLFAGAAAGALLLALLLRRGR